MMSPAGPNSVRPTSAQVYVPATSGTKVGVRVVAYGKGAVEPAGALNRISQVRLRDHELARRRGATAMAVQQCRDPGAEAKEGDVDDDGWAHVSGGSTPRADARRQTSQGP